MRYFGFGDPTDWDRGRLHEPSMGVELVDERGDRFFVSWGDAFGHFGLELWAAGARQVLVNDPVADDVTGHPWWRPLLHFEVHAKSIWRSGEVDSPDPAPVALVLAAGGARIWIASGETNPDHGLLLGLDGVIVTADPALARELALD